MNAKRINQIIEVLFQGGPGDEAPEPINKRFQWKNPATGKAPPRPPKEIMPTEKDMSDLDTTFTAPPGHDNPTAGRYDAPKPAAPAPGQEAPLDDRTGSVPMSQMIGRSEMATIDDLLDRYLAMQKTHGPERARTWFDQYRTAEFESALRKLVDALLG